MPDDNYVHPYHDLNGAEVLITGGRGTLGAATAEAFAKLGAKVWCLDVSPVPASDSPNIVHRQADVTDRESLEKIQKEIAQGPGLNVLINAHGIQVFGSPMRQKGGSIVNIGSVNGVVVSGKGTPYGIQKAAVSFMTKVLAVEWAPAVRVNAIAPTAIPSNMTSDLFVNSVYLEKKLPTIPLQRIGSTEDIAHAIVFLSSAASGLITGHTLVMDGGISLI